MFGALAVAQWGIAFTPVSGVLVVFLIGSLGWAAWKRRWGSVVLLVAATPLALGFVRGLVTYGRDDAHMMSLGLHSSESAFIHPTTRLPVATRGCLVDGSEWVWDDPYNAALILMSRLLGPAPGTYDGPIPTEDEARRALDGASPLDWRALATDELVVDGRSIALQRLLGPALVDACYSFDPLADDPQSPLAPDGLLRASVWRDRVLLIEMTAERYWTPDDARAHVALVAVDSGRIFGHFVGSCRGHGFPLPWRPVGPRILDMDYREGPPPLSPDG